MTQTNDQIIEHWVFYRLKSGIGTLCFRVLDIINIDEKNDIAELRVDWFSEKTGLYWLNLYGLPLKWKTTITNLKRFEKFKPTWV